MGLATIRKHINTEKRLSRLTNTPTETLKQHWLYCTQEGGKKRKMCFLPRDVLTDMSCFSPGQVPLVAHATVAETEGLR